MRAPTTSTSAVEPASRSNTALSSSRTMAVLSQPSSKASNVQWPANIASPVTRLRSPSSMSRCLSRLSDICLRYTVELGVQPEV
jgi:hypothetical protein